jgi:hypothetical protein
MHKRNESVKVLFSGEPLAMKAIWREEFMQ